MLQYDLTETNLFSFESPARVPSDAEMFVVTAALLLVYEAAYSDLHDGEIALTLENLDAVADCIEQRLPEFTRDLEAITMLRDRLQDLVGLRIRCVGLGTGPPKPS